MKKRDYLLVLVLIMALLIFVGCSGEASEETTMTESEMKVFTLDELKTFDGKDGNPAYVAVEGVVYDVTDVSAWTGGTHNGNMAGLDVTDAIMNQSPHGTSKLKGLPVVGKLEE